MIHALVATFLVVNVLHTNPYPKAELLIEVDVLKTAKKEQVRILDVRDKKDYLAGHIPGAVSVDLAAWSKAMNETFTAEQWSVRLGEIGVDSQTAIVVYGDDLRESARLWWMLKFLGLEKVQLLNGGWQAWTEAKYDQEKTENKPALRMTEIKKIAERLATKEQVLDKVKDKSAIILDARTTGEYCGERKISKQAGAIPGAIHLEWSELIDAKTQKFKPLPELQKLIQERKVDLDKPIITYCQGGGRSSVVAFGMELLGGKQIRNYYRSWGEWGNDLQMPVEKGKK